MSQSGASEERAGLERRLVAYAATVGAAGDPGGAEEIHLELSDVEGDVGFELDAASDAALLSLGGTGSCGPPAERSPDAGLWLPSGPRGRGSLELLALGASGVLDWRRKREAIEPAA